MPVLIYSARGSAGYSVKNSAISRAGSGARNRAESTRNSAGNSAGSGARNSAGSTRNRAGFTAAATTFLITIALLGGCASESGPACDTPPCEPQASLQNFEIADGFSIELFAAEPLFRDPVAMEVDPSGRFYVVEDPGYPEGVGGNGAIRLLEDSDGDGLPDRSTVFADGLRAPRGVMSWDDGIIVTDAPNIYYMEDTTGDGQADLIETLMEGFAFGNPQLGVNTPIYGLDNWIHFAHMTGSSTPYLSEEPENTQPSGSGNILFRPDSREWRVRAGSSQFGHTFDAFGRPLQVLHNNHISQQIFEARYLARNPDLITAPASTSISDHGTSSEIYPITENSRYELFTDLGSFTAACGITCYLGGLLPDDYHGAAFVAEPAHNLVHVDRLNEEGIPLVASRMEEGREFLASTDRWFRPVNMYIGPDGALYLIDYYREIIEQPRFLSEEVLASGMLYDGTDRGRIYRIVPEGSESPEWLNRLNLQEAESSELVTYLEHENIWWRRTAQRLLVDRADGEVREALEEMAVDGRTPESRVHAVWTLQGLGHLSPELVDQMLSDSAPAVREHAVRLSERYLEGDTGLYSGGGREVETDPTVVDDLTGRLMTMADDENLRVRFQLLNTLGFVETEPSRELRLQLLYRDLDDEWMQLAALTAADLDYVALFDHAVATFTGEPEAGRELWFRRLGMMIGAEKSPAGIDRLVRSIDGQVDVLDDWWQAAALQGLAEGLRHGSVGIDPEGVRAPMARLSLHPTSSQLRRSAQQVLRVVGAPAGGQVLARAKEIAVDQDEDPELRVDAITLLGTLAGQGVEQQELLLRLIEPRQPNSVQAAAASGLARYEGEEIGRELMERWNQLTPQVRAAAMEAMLADDDRIRMVLDAVEEGELPRSQVTLQQTRTLMLHRDEEISLRTQHLLGLPDDSGEARSEVVEQYQPALEIEGDPERGREIYARACAMCHQVDGELGTAFGPDLASVRNRDPEALLVDILIPDAEITAGFEQWRIERNSGGTVVGVISSETPSSITVRNIAGEDTAIAREDISQMEAVGTSAMPAGLENQISVEEMADLIEMLRSPR